MTWEERNFSLQNSGEVTDTEGDVNTASLRAMSRRLGKAAFLTSRKGYEELEGEKKGGVSRCSQSIL